MSDRDPTTIGEKVRDAAHRHFGQAFDGFMGRRVVPWGKIQDLCQGSDGALQPWGRTMSSIRAYREIDRVSTDVVSLWKF